jgi:hypothetical protein
MILFDISSSSLSFSLSSLTSFYFSSFKAYWSHSPNNNTCPDEIPQTPGYIVFYNSTEAIANNHNSPVLPFVRSLDEALLSINTGADVKIESIQRDFPRAKLRIAGYDVVAANGGVWFYIPPMITFFVLLTEIVMEKEQRLRLGMKMMGLKDSMYWLVWFLTGLIFVFVSTLVLIAAGHACRFDVFKNTNVFVIFLLFFLYGMAIQR